MKTWFEIWALGYSKKHFALDIGIFLGKFFNYADAKEHADNFLDSSYIPNLENEDFNPKRGDYIALRIEEVQKCEDGDTECVDLKYETILPSVEEVS